MSKFAVIIFSILISFVAPESLQAKVNAPTMIRLPTKANLKTKELVAEINQNFAYYCMKKSSGFKKESHCFKHTDKIASTCSNQHKKINGKLLSCVLKKLSKRKL